MINEAEICWPMQCARVVALLAVIAAATNIDVLTVLFDVFAADTRVSCPQCLVVIYNVLYIVAPFFALVGLLLAKPWGFIGLFIFPLVALLFEVPALPFVGLIVSDDKITKFFVITALNLAIVLLSWLLYKKYRKITGNNSLFS